MSKYCLQGAFALCHIMKKNENRQKTTDSTLADSKDKSSFCSEMEDSIPASCTSESPSVYQWSPPTTYGHGSGTRLQTLGLGGGAGSVPTVEDPPHISSGLPLHNAWEPSLGALPVSFSGGSGGLPTTCPSPLGNTMEFCRIEERDELHGFQWEDQGASGQPINGKDQTRTDACEDRWGQ